MSIADLKMRLADVPGIESLSMAFEARRITLRWGTGYSASVDAAASDGDIEAAIRNAIKLAPVSPAADKPAVPRRLLQPEFRACPVILRPLARVSKPCWRTTFA